jgi:hypothetical protein
MKLSDYIYTLYIDEPVTSDELKYSEQQLKIAALNHSLVLRRYRLHGMIENPDQELLVGEDTDERIKKAQERKRISTERNAKEQENQNELIRNIRKQLRRKRELERERNRNK